MANAVASHIWLDERGVAWVDDTNVKVIELAMDYRSGMTNPLDVVQSYDGLTPSQVHSAFSYYLDNQDQFDAEIQRQSTEYEKLRADALDSPGRRRLRSVSLVGVNCPHHSVPMFYR